MVTITYDPMFDSRTWNGGLDSISLQDFTEPRRTSMKSSFGYRFVLALSLFNSFSTANAVEVTARIEGTVTDPSGAFIPNAQVTATNTETGVVTNTTTSAIGDYIFQKLPIGTYSISVSVPGFSRYNATGIILNIDQEYVLPIKLSVGSPTETIEVKANAVQINTTDM